MSTTTHSPKRGEIWIVNFDPTLGSEIRKRRPAVVISSNDAGSLPVKLVAPITAWDYKYAGKVWHVQVKAAQSNGLVKTSSVDTMQLRSADVQRFLTRIGSFSKSEMDEINFAIASVIEYEP